MEVPWREVGKTFEWKTASSVIPQSLKDKNLSLQPEGSCSYFIHIRWLVWSYMISGATKRQSRQTKDVIFSPFKLVSRWEKLQICKPLNITSWIIDLVKEWETVSVSNLVPLQQFDFVHRKKVFSQPLGKLSTCGWVLKSKTILKEKPAVTLCIAEFVKSHQNYFYHILIFTLLCAVVKSPHKCKVLCFGNVRVPNLMS